MLKYLVQTPIKQPVIPQNAADQDDFLIIRMKDQHFAIPAVRITDIIKPQPITAIPLVKPEIVGLQNLKGRIVTVVDLALRLGLEGDKQSKKRMFIVVENNKELYAFVVDEIIEARTLSLINLEKNPENMPVIWKSVSKGVFKLDDRLMLVLDVGNVLKF